MLHTKPKLIPAHDLRNANEQVVKMLPSIIKCKNKSTLSRLSNLMSILKPGIRLNNMKGNQLDQDLGNAL